MKKVLFFSSVKDVSLFNTQKFYSIDIEILRNLGYDVRLVNDYRDFFRLKYDFAYIFFYTRGLVPALISRFRFKKVYFTGGIDNLDSSYAQKISYKIQSLLFRICRFISNDCLIVSESDLMNVRNVYKKNLPSKLDLVFHAIKINDFSCELNEKTNNFASICWMESLVNVRRKGLETSLYYFKYLSSFEEFKDSKYYLIGKEGTGSDYIKSIIDKLEISERVVFTGVVDERVKIDYLKKSKYYFQLSMNEGFGIAALEALASKCIVIHSGKGGLKEVVGDNGILLDIDKFDDSILSKIKSFDNEVIEEAYQRIKRTYDFDCRLRRIEEILNRN